MGESSQPGGADHRRAVVVERVAKLGVASVERHSDAQVDALGPPLPRELLLRAQRGGDRIDAATERGHDAVALPLLDRPNTTMRSDHIGQDLVVAADRLRHRLGRRLP